MGIFGWSYPPGCSGPPEEPAICQVCLGNVDRDECICPECPACGEFGNPDCYTNHNLVMSQEQIDQKNRILKEEEEAAKEEEAMIDKWIQNEEGHNG